VSRNEYIASDVELVNAVRTVLGLDALPSTEPPAKPRRAFMSETTLEGLSIPDGRTPRRLF
jgi:hypothetical protein